MTVDSTIRNLRTDEPHRWINIKCPNCFHATSFPCCDHVAALKARVAELEAKLLEMPTAPEGMGDDAYTDYCTGADGTKKQPYPQRRNRQCSIGYHEECSDPAGERCKCPCHWLALSRSLSKQEEPK